MLSYSVNALLMDRQAKAKVLSNAALTIQCFVRTCRAKRKCIELAQDVFEKVLDHQTGKYFYFNLRYGSSRWKTPVFLTLANSDIRKESHACLKDDAAIYIQAIWRGAIYRSRQGNQCLVRRQFNLHVLHSGKQLSQTIRNRSRAQVLIDKAQDEARTNLLNINLSHIGIERVSSRLYALGNQVMTLVLSYNNLHLMNPLIGTLQCLTLLDVSHNNIEYIPNEIGNLKHLRCLNISSNKLRSYTASVYLLPLEQLDVSYNQLHEIPVESGNMGLHEITKEWEVGIGLSTNLKELRASNNFITEFPPQLGRCTFLQVLDLSKNMIKEIMSEIYQCTKLEILRLSSNQIKSLPIEMGVRLFHLRELHVDNNQLTNFPANFLIKNNGWATTLSILNIDCNNFKGLLPESLGYLENLDELSFKYNKVEGIHSSISAMTRLSRFLGDSNRIKDLSQSMCRARNLRLLSLSNNLISSIDMLGQLFKLKTLDLSGNKIQSLTGLETLLSIRSINLSRNRIITVPPGKPKQFYDWPIHILKIDSILIEFCQLKSLVRLNLSCNEILELPSNIGDMCRIKVLDASFNRLSSIPSSFPSLQTLADANLSNNCLTSEGFPENFENLVKLQKLGINGNCFKDYPSVLNELNLYHVNLCNSNPIHVYTNERKPSSTMQSQRGNVDLMDTLSIAEMVIDQFQAIHGIQSGIFAEHEPYKCAHTQFMDLGILQMKVGQLTSREIDTQSDALSSVIDQSSNRSSAKPALKWFQRAIQSFIQAEEVCCCLQCYEVFYNRAICHKLINELSISLSLFDQVLHLRQNHIPSLYEKTLLLYDIGNFYKAIHSATELLSILESGQETSSSAVKPLIQQVISESNKSLKIMGACTRKLQIERKAYLTKSKQQLLSLSNEHRVAISTNNSTRTDTISMAIKAARICLSKAQNILDT